MVLVGALVRSRTGLRQLLVRAALQQAPMVRTSQQAQQLLTCGLVSQPPSMVLLHPLAVLAMRLPVEVAAQAGLELAVVPVTRYASMELQQQPLMA